MIETEILIVGGGPAGATAARYLSKSNIPNILIQKKLNFKKPCGGAIRLDAFNEFDINKNMIKSYVDKVVLIFKKEKITIDIRSTPLAVVERSEFDNYLREKAVQEGSVLYEAKLLNLEKKDNYIISTIKFKNKIEIIKSNYVIAADGVHSSIRKIINGDKVSSLLLNHNDVQNFNCKNCEFHFGSKIAGNYYAWAFPNSNGTNIGTLANGKKPYMNNFINSLGIEQVSKFYGYKIPEFDNNIFYKDNVYFVGDSASQVLPFTYEGIYYAMSSAKLLSEIISNHSEPEQYQIKWEQKYLKKFTTLKKLQKIFLYNDYTISLMMRLYKSRIIQNKMVELWLKDIEIKINFNFFIKTLRYIR